MREICETEAADDGLRFDAATIIGQRIKEDAEYQAVRITFTALLERARIPMQVDIGFGDVVHPTAEERDYPTLLDVPAPRLCMYPRETVIAEKFEAMVHLGTLNSRMKDFFDVWLLAREFDFMGTTLARAIQKTFERRGTTLEAEPIALTPAFTLSEDRQRQWAAFVKRSQLSSVPDSLDALREPLRNFLTLVVTAVIRRETFEDHWQAPGPWRKGTAR